MATPQELLTAVEAAIAALLVNRPVQSYEIDGRRLDYLSLNDLRQLRRELLGEVSATRSSRNYARFARPR